jgi:hypothetical protein
MIGDRAAEDLICLFNLFGKPQIDQPNLNTPILHVTDEDVLRMNVSMCNVLTMQIVHCRE